MSEQSDKELNKLSSILGQPGNNPIDQGQLKVSGMSINNPSGEDERQDQQQAEFQPEGYSQRIYVDLFRQIEAEIQVMEAILQKVQKKKAKARRFICKYAAKNNEALILKPRNCILVHMPSVTDEADIIATIQSERQLISRIAASSVNIYANPTRNPLPSLMQPRPIENYYDAQLNLLLSLAAKTQMPSLENSRQILSSVIRHDFTTSAKSMHNHVLYMKFSYDFLPPNPLLLLASRWTFVSHVEQVVRYIFTKRRTWKETSELHYDAYKAEFKRWERCKAEPKSESRSIAVKKVDIYGRESPLIIPRSSVLPSVGFCLDSPVPPGKSMNDLDPDICKFVYYNLLIV